MNSNRENSEARMTLEQRARVRNINRVDPTKNHQGSVNEARKGNVIINGVYTNNANQPRQGGKPRQAAKPDKWTKSGSRIIQGKEKTVYTNPKYPKQVRVKTMPVGSDGHRSAVYVVVKGKK
jgi:hypothetical protein